MNLKEELKEFRSAPADLRKFGLVVGAVFALLALWFWFRQKDFWPWLLLPALPLIVLALIYPRSLRVPYLAWMSLALVLGVIMSTILLTLFYYLVITPIGIAARIAGKDFLSRKWGSRAETFWIRREAAVERKPSDYERQYELLL